MKLFCSYLAVGYAIWTHHRIGAYRWNRFEEFAKAIAA
jgi:hypothetical protein